MKTSPCQDCAHPIKVETEGYFEDQVGHKWCKPCGYRRFHGRRDPVPPCVQKAGL